MKSICPPCLPHLTALQCSSTLPARGLATEEGATRSLRCEWKKSAEATPEILTKRTRKRNSGRDEERGAPGMTSNKKLVTKGHRYQ